MYNELFRNGSGYVDITAYKAINNIERSNSGMKYQRGEIFEYEMRDRYETKKALVVSANFRAGGRYISIIVMTDEPKGEVSVPIVCQGMMYADCGMVSFATDDRFGNYIRSASAEEMAQIDEGIARCLGIEQKTVEVPVEKIVEVPGNVVSITDLSSDEGFSEELATAKAEAKIFKDLYEKLLAKVMG